MKICATPCLTFEQCLIFQYSLHAFHVDFKNDSGLSQCGWIHFFFFWKAPYLCLRGCRIRFAPISRLNHSSDCSLFGLQWDGIVDTKRRLVRKVSLNLVSDAGPSIIQMNIPYTAPLLYLKLTVWSWALEEEPVGSIWWWRQITEEVPLAKPWPARPENCMANGQIHFVGSCEAEIKGLWEL